MKSITRKGLQALVVGGAILNTTLGTLTNPFIENRKNPSRRWHSTMENFDVDLWDEVKNCADCHGDTDTIMYRKGDTDWNRGEPLHRPERQHDSHCVKHWRRVARYQHHYRRGHR